MDTVGIVDGSSDSLSDCVDRTFLHLYKSTKFTLVERFLNVDKPFNPRHVSTEKASAPTELGTHKGRTARCSAQSCLFWEIL